MDPLVVGLLCVLGLFIFMMMGIPIVYSLGFVSVCTAFLVYGKNALYLAGTMPFSMLFRLDWTALPLFVLMGSIIAASGMGKDVFYAASKWLSRIPGGLVVAGIVAEGVIASTLGTSAACIMVVGKAAVPEFERLGYNRAFALGALLAGGVLGPLIPPSATLIIYGVLTHTSIGKLFIAGIIPGIILIFFLSIPTIILCKIKPGLAPKTFSVTWKERFSSLKNVWPVPLIVLAVLGTLYSGIATPTEVAGVAVFFALIISIFVFRLRWQGLKEALIEAATINGIILFIMVVACYFTYVVGSTNIAERLLAFVKAAGIPTWNVILSINLILLFLGCIIDPITITLLTIPIFYPIVVNLGLDPVWFGIIFCVNTQIGLITPPMGVDLFAIKTVFNIPTMDILKGVMPFLISELLFLALICAFPEISLWLPAMMVQK